MHVEDHPLEYGEFEGVIPEGYGAGIVMLWDRGTWTPESTTSTRRSKKGDLKFTLDGYKLKGSWVLVRTSGGYAGAPAAAADGRRWLLIKHRDDWSGDLDIAEFAPLSVKSDGDFEDILAAGQPGRLALEPPGEGRRDRRDVRPDHRTGDGDAKIRAPGSGIRNSGFEEVKERDSDNHEEEARDKKARHSKRHAEHEAVTGFGYTARMRIALAIAALILLASLPSAQTVDPGRTTFVNRCAGCHGSDGNGGELGPGIATRVPSRTDQDLMTLLRDRATGRGHAGHSPA